MVLIKMSACWINCLCKCHTKTSLFFYWTPIKKFSIKVFSIKAGFLCATYVACAKCCWVTKPKLIVIALFTWLIACGLKHPIFSFSRFLSIVRICSNNTTESFISPQFWAPSWIWVGSFALDCWLVIAAAITVGLNLLPISFCTINTGRTPPCSEPTTGLKSA